MPIIPNHAPRLLQTSPFTFHPSNFTLQTSPFRYPPCFVKKGTAPPVFRLIARQPLPNPYLQGVVMKGSFALR
jgi:hypothetical protein